MCVGRSLNATITQCFSYPRLLIQPLASNDSEKLMIFATRKHSHAHFPLDQILPAGAALALPVFPVVAAAAAVGLGIKVRTSMLVPNVHRSSLHTLAHRKHTTISKSPILSQQRRCPGQCVLLFGGTCCLFAQNLT